MNGDKARSLLYALFKTLVMCSLYNNFFLGLHLGIWLCQTKEFDS